MTSICEIKLSGYSFFIFLLLVFPIILYANDDLSEQSDADSENIEIVIKQDEQSSLDWSGIRMMEEVYNRHQQFPYIYEEQSMVMVDRKGDRDTRKARRYSRVEDDGTVKFLLLFVFPREVKGVALLASRDPSGLTSKHVYLPAYGETLIESSGAGSDGNFLGTDFSIESLMGEVLSDYHYVRRNDEKINDSLFYVIDVYQSPGSESTEKPLRRHFIRQDNFYIVQTNYFDKLGRLQKQQTHHDLTPVDGDMWRANMILMDDKKEHHQSLIKIDRRIFSLDYVPQEIFTSEWLYENYPALKQTDVDNTDEDNQPDNESLIESDVEVSQSTGNQG